MRAQCFCTTCLVAWLRVGAQAQAVIKLGECFYQCVKSFRQQLSKYSSQNIQHVRVLQRMEISFLGRNIWQCTSFHGTFRKKWFNYENVASGRDIDNEPLPTSLHCPNASFLLLCFASVTHQFAAKGKVQQPLLVSSALHMALGLADPDFSRGRADRER